MRISLNSYPSQPKTYTVDMPKLAGGLNLQELDYRLDPNESPEMRNLWWAEDILQCRDGQVYLSDDATLGEGFACSRLPYFDETFYHIGTGLYRAGVTRAVFSLTKLIDGVPENRGTFFRYQDSLYYKNKGGFFEITYDGVSFTASKVKDKAYTPVIVINASPTNGAGSMYQPENRISPKKTVWYNADGSTEYHLPTSPVDSIVEVIVDGTVVTNYTADLAKGTVTFSAAPPTTEPATNNTVKITYSKANPDAENSVMDCEYAFVAGGDTNLCIILGGCDAQPNAVFWNSNDNLSMNPAYWPIEYYNLVGDTEDAVTGFGKQYSTLVVLKEHSLGKLTFGTEDLDGRNSISFAYEDINNHVGCDLPWTIQLVENNLTFANSYRGIHVLRSSSAAYENNVDCVSEKVNGSATGMLHDLRNALSVTSFDDDTRYWVCADGVCYVWDYANSTVNDPSWFYFTNVPAVCFYHDDAHKMYHLDNKGRITAFERVFSDYGEAIEKVYRFPTQLFGGYDRLKDVLYILLSIRSDTDSDIDIKYESDYETRYDMTPVRTYSYRLSPRNLTRRCLSSSRYAFVAKRRPGCRHIRHFSMTLSNNKAGEDLAIVSMQIYYRYQGKER